MFIRPSDNMAIRKTRTGNKNQITTYYFDIERWKIKPDVQKNKLNLKIVII